MRPFFYEPSGPLDPECLRDVLGLVSVTIPAERMRRWTKFERLIAYDWAIREHLMASDNYQVRARPKPAFVSDAQQDSNIVEMR